MLELLCGLQLLWAEGRNKTFKLSESQVGVAKV